ncbi:hypothetical protein PENSPDRAFT_687645 [Peniophora sp. CONT]|nr:hypothetical protein PENSPDRAFT_687645 [Peniophora sp. CONT]
MSSAFDHHQSPFPSPLVRANSASSLTAPYASPISPIPQSSDPFFRRFDSLDPYDDMLARTYSNPHSHSRSHSQSNTAHEHSRADISWEGGLSLSGSPLNPGEPHRPWERVARRRMQRWRVVKTVTLALIAAWTTYTGVRYFIAFVMYRSSTRRTLSLALGVSSLVALSLSLVLASSKPVLGPLVRTRPDLLRLFMVAARIARACVTLLTLGPAIVNLVLVFVWRNDGDPEVRLRGRCRWDIDVDWTTGVGSRCESPTWGVWLAAAIVRLVMTAMTLVVYHVACLAHDRARSAPRARIPDMKERPESSALTSPQPVTFTLRSRDSMGVPAPATPPPNSSPRRSIWERRSGSITVSAADHSSGSQTVSSHESGSTAHESRPVLGSHPTPTSAEQANLLAAQDLQNFANSFRDLVGRVSRDLEDGSLSPASESPRTPPLHSVMSTHTPYVSLDEFGRPVPPHENVAVFGRPVRRMPTIESMGTFATTPGTDAPHSPTAGSMLSNQSRAPTRMSMATMSIPSAPPSRSNSLTQGPAQPREPPRIANEAVDHDLRRTPVSTSSFHTAKTNVSGSNSGSGSGSGSGLSRSNSLNAVDLLTPVDEHELTPGQIVEHRTASPEDYGQVVRAPGDMALSRTLSDSKGRPRTAPM